MMGTYSFPPKKIDFFFMFLSYSFGKVGYKSIIFFLPSDLVNHNFDEFVQVSTVSSQKCLSVQLGSIPC